MANQTAQAQSRLLIGVAPEQLPYPYRRLLNEKRPLRNPTHFIPHGIVSLWVPLLVGAPLGVCHAAAAAAGRAPLDRNGRICLAHKPGDLYVRK